MSIRVYIEAPNASALSKAMAQVVVDLSTEVKESHYTANPHMPYTIDFRNDGGPE